MCSIENVEDQVDYKRTFGRSGRQNLEDLIEISVYTKLDKKLKINCVNKSVV